MNKTKPLPGQAQEAAADAAADAPAEAAATPAGKPVKRSAMKLPSGVGPKGSQGPQVRRPWENGGSGKPQTDAARRAGKSRKVH